MGILDKISTWLNDKSNIAKIKAQDHLIQYYPVMDKASSVLSHKKNILY